MKNILNNKTIKIMVLLLYMFFMSASSFVFADIGGFNSYDSFGSYGGYSDSSSSSFFGGDSSYSSDDDGFSWLSSNRYHSDSSFEMISIILILIFFIILFLYVKTKRFIGRTSLRTIDDVPLPNENINEIVFKAKQNDIDFDAYEFEKMVGDVFVKLQNAWSNRTIEDVREYETPELFEQHLNQINEYKQEGKINIIEELKVNSVHIKGYEEENDKEIMTVEVCSRMKDYVIDEKTNRVIEGKKHNYWRMIYQLKFTRKIGTVKENNKNIKCQNCGSVIEGDATMKCKYCGSVIVQEDYTWALADIQNIKQNRL